MPPSLERFPPARRDKARIQVWKQGNYIGCRKDFVDPKKAFDAFETILDEYEICWNDVTVIWSRPDNEPSLINGSKPASPVSAIKSSENYEQL